MEVTACGTDAIGIEHCRSIESARCEAKAECGDLTDVEGCKRYYHDNCLHGLPGPASPEKERVDECVEAIRASADCAKDDPKTLLTDCDPLALTRGQGQALENVCDAIREPQKTNQCDFLLPQSDGEGGAAGDQGD